MTRVRFPVGRALLAHLVVQFWDGRATTVEHQAGMPVVNPIEMGDQSEDDVVARVAAIPGYVAAFREAYDAEVDYEGIRNAIGAFERTLADRYLAVEPREGI